MASMYASFFTALVIALLVTKISSFSQHPHPSLSIRWHLNSLHSQTHRRKSNHPSTFTQLQSQKIPKIKNVQSSSSSSSSSRFKRKASNITATDIPTVLTIHGVDYNVTDWANAHPGGVAVLKRYRHEHHHHHHHPNMEKNNSDRRRKQPDATEAFEAAGHSKEAWKMLQQFRIEQAGVIPNGNTNTNTQTTTITYELPSTKIGAQSKLLLLPNNTLQRWRAKLFTKEDPQSIHKVLGIYALVHFIYRIYQMLLKPDLAAGMGSNLGKGAKISAILCLIPHFALSISSLIFDTVPRERVVGKPMIWKENRIHSIVFGTRSMICTAFAWLSVRAGHSTVWRTVSVWGSALCILATMFAADVATAKLGPSEADSSVATLPFWEGCSDRMQRRIKRFYAFTQFAATTTCLSVGNPAWPFLLLFPIQLSSFLLTLSRKGLISGVGWHIGYGASLVLPFFVALRTALVLDFVGITFVSLLLGTSVLLFQLRCLGVNKYLLWVPVIFARVFFGDRIIPYEMW